jgi:hypothetical protein
MTIGIPLDLPGHSFTQQLEALERWAFLSHGTLLDRSTSLAESWDARDGMTPVILECIGHKTWEWPAYLEHTNQHGREFSSDPARDMAEHIYNKFRTNRNALYRKQQMVGLLEFRPFWQIVGACAGSEKRTYRADDDYWQNGCSPWNCPKLRCDCRVDSLSRIELTEDKK